MIETKVLLFFSIMVVSLIISFLVGHKWYKREKKVWQAAIYSFLVNILILGSSSIWWFQTETDGFSQYFGVMFNCIALGIITALQAIVLLVRKFKKNSFAK
jgi:hypothetical protein